MTRGRSSCDIFCHHSTAVLHGLLPLLGQAVPMATTYLFGIPISLFSRIIRLSAAAYRSIPGESDNTLSSNVQTHWTRPHCISSTTTAHPAKLLSSRTSAENASSAICGTMCCKGAVLHNLLQSLVATSIAARFNGRIALGMRWEHKIPGEVFKFAPARQSPLAMEIGQLL